MIRMMSIIVGASLLWAGHAAAQQRDNSFNPMIPMLQGQAIAEGLARAQREGEEQRWREEQREHQREQWRRGEQQPFQEPQPFQSWQPSQPFQSWQPSQPLRGAYEHYPRTPVVTNPYSPYIGLPKDLAEGELQREILQLREKIDALERQRR